MGRCPLLDQPQQRAENPSCNPAEHWLLILSQIWSASGRDANLRITPFFFCKWRNGLSQRSIKTPLLSASSCSKSSPSLLLQVNGPPGQGAADLLRARGDETTEYSQEMRPTHPHLRMQ